jgi:phosphatidylglycerophosphatase A
MTPQTDKSTETASTAGKKPSLALALATALYVGYIPFAPGTFGSLVGVLTAFFSAVFFLHPSSIGELFSSHPLADAMMTRRIFLPPGADPHDMSMILPLIVAFGMLALLVAIGVWSSTRAAAYAGVEDPQFVVIDEVAGQHLTLLLPLIPIALPRLAEHYDFSLYAIFFALSLVNWKYLLLGFILFRVFDIWKPFPLRRLEKLPGGWGIMADDWAAGVYAAILLRLALHFGWV